MSIVLFKRTFVVQDLPMGFWKSTYKDQLHEALFGIGATKVKRVGNGNRSRLYVSFVENSKSNDSLCFAIERCVMKWRYDHNV